MARTRLFNPKDRGLVKKALDKVGIEHLFFEEQGRLYIQANCSDRQLDRLVKAVVAVIHDEEEPDD